MSTADFLKRSLQTISLVSDSCGPLIPVPSLVLTLAASGGEFHPKMVTSSSSQPTTRRAEPSAFGNAKAYGSHGFSFFTREKAVTSRWLDPSHGGINLGFPQS